MCREMEKIYQEGREQPIVTGEMKKARETAISLAEMGITVEKIAQAVRMSVTIVQDWIAESLGVAR